MLRLEHYSSYVTHTHHGRPSCPQQRFYMVIPLKEQFLSRPSKKSQYMSDQAETCWTSRKTEGTLWQSPQSQRSMHSQSQGNKSSSFTTNKAQAPVKWTTGTVTEILECGQSYMVQDPNSRVYRRNSSFEAHMSWQHLSRPSSEKKGRNSHQNNSFQDHQPRQGQIHVFPEGNQLYGHQIHVVWWTQHTHQTPPTSPPSSPLRGATHLDHCHGSPPASFPSREPSVGPSSEDSSPEGRKETPVWPCDIDQGTLTWTSSPVSWNITIGTLQNTAAGQHQTPREN